jgi:osmotically-inducible protein OsmY
MKTDTTLLSDVQAELDWDPSFDNRGIIAAVKDGVVTLAGHVSSYSDRWAAEKAVKRVLGVRAIANDIDVKLGDSSKRPDGDIAAAVVNALQSNVSVPTNDIKAMVTDEWVTLEGKVAHWYQKNAAEHALRNLWGIRGVTNSIEIKPQAYAGDVRGKIHQTFKRHADMDADKVRVAVADGTVTLTGEVTSWHEKQDAEIAAWSAPGVSRVRNMLSVRL